MPTSKDVILSPPNTNTQVVGVKFPRDFHLHGPSSVFRPFLPVPSEKGTITFCYGGLGFPSNIVSERNSRVTGKGNAKKNKRRVCNA